MSQQEIHVVQTTPAPPEAVWRLLGDSTTWPDWTAIDSVVIETPAGPDGQGEVRAVRSGRYVIREAVEPAAPTRLTYVVLGGLPVRDYRAVITLAPVATGGTEISWHTTFAPKILATGGLLRRRLQKLTVQFADGLARASAGS